jgi:hypothetical protein
MTKEPTNPSPGQIDSSAQAAERHLQQASSERAAREAAEAGAKATKRRAMAVLPVLALVAVLGVQYDTLRFWTIGPSQAAVRADLEAALTQAAIDVKAYQLRTGAMPDKLPNAALAGVVTYKKTSRDNAVLIAKVGKETKVKRI